MQNTPKEQWTSLTGWRCAFLMKNNKVCFETGRKLPDIWTIARQMYDRLHFVGDRCNKKLVENDDRKKLFFASADIIRTCATIQLTSQPIGLTTDSQPNHHIIHINHSVRKQIKSSLQITVTQVIKKDDFLRYCDMHTYVGTRNRFKLVLHQYINSHCHNVISADVISADVTEEDINRALEKWLYYWQPPRAYVWGGLGVKPPLELDIFQKLCYLRKEIHRFRIQFASWFVDLMQITGYEFACKFQGTL